jgi:hypothetical protein
VSLSWADNIIYCIIQMEKYARTAKDAMYACLETGGVYPSPRAKGVCSFPAQV